MICTSCQNEVTSASHCANVSRSVLPYGILTLDNTHEQIVSTAKILAGCVSSTERSFPSEYRGYQMGLIKQTVACAVSDEDFIDVAPELEKAIFFALHPRN